MSAGHVRSVRNGSTASWLEPESNHTSRMSRSRSKLGAAARRARQAGGMNSSIGRSYHASAPYSSNTRGRALDQRRRQQRLAALRAVHRRDRHTPGALPRDAPVGPVRQHVVDAVAPPRRDPLDVAVDGVEPGLTQRPSPSAVRSPARRPCRMNHCDVARKITGLWQRQQCGYWCAKSSRCHSRPRSFSACSTCGLASNTRWPPNSSTVSRKCPPGPDRRVDLEPVAHARVEVVGAVARRRVHRARAGVERDVVAQHAERDRARRADAGSGCARAARP